MRVFISAILMLFVWAMPARAVTIDPTLTFFAQGPCFPHICDAFESAIYYLDGGTDVSFGTATFFATQDPRYSTPCDATTKTVCGFVLGSAYVRYSHVLGDLPNLQEADYITPRQGMCIPFDNPPCIAPTYLLDYVLPVDAIGIQLVIGGSRFSITPPELQVASVPLPGSLILLFFALAMMACARFLSDSSFSKMHFSSALR